MTSARDYLESGRPAKAWRVWQKAEAALCDTALDDALKLHILEQL